MDDRVFICYSRKDEDFVLKLATNLKRQGVPIWLDQWDIPSGANWNRTIENALKQCTHLFLVLSPSSVESYEVECEWNSVLNEKKVIVPILYQTCQMPFRLKPIQYIDFTSRSPDDTIALEQVISALEMKKGIPAKSIVQSEQISKKISECLNRGNAFSQLRKYDEAIQAYDEAIQIDPLNANAWYNKGNILSKQGEIICRGDDPNKGALFRQKRYDEAIKAYDEATHIDPLNADAWYNKAKALCKRKKYDQATQAFNKAIQLDLKYALLQESATTSFGGTWEWISFLRNNASIWCNKGNALFKHRMYDEAIQAYDRAIQIDPLNADAWYNKAFVLHNQKKYDEAVKAYDRTTEINPQYTNAWGNKGIALYKKKKYDEAVKAYDEVIKLEPKNAEKTWYRKALALHDNRKYDEAVKAYDRVIEINPRYSLAWNNKGNALKVQGKYDEAVKAYDEVIKLEPQDVKAWLYKGDALFQVKKYDEAIKSFDEVIKLKPQDANPQNISILAQTWYNKSEALKLLGHTKEADSALAMARNLGFSESVIRKISHKLHNILEGP